jgi:hypothetical protein
MAIPQVNCATGQQAGDDLVAGIQFQWINFKNSDCTVSDCSAWCNLDSYTVPAMSGGTPGFKNAHTRSDVAPGTYPFASGCSDVPGNPRVIIKG